VEENIESLSNNPQARIRNRIMMHETLRIFWSMWLLDTVYENGHDVGGFASKRHPDLTIKFALQSVMLAIMVGRGFIFLDYGLRVERSFIDCRRRDTPVSNNQELGQTDGSLHARSY
jgi:hypothetical protein